jgi:hypothetical protein
VPADVDHADGERETTRIRLRADTCEQLEGSIERRMPLLDQPVHGAILR